MAYASYKIENRFHFSVFHSHSELKVENYMPFGLLKHIFIRLFLISSMSNGCGLLVLDPCICLMQRKIHHFKQFIIQNWTFLLFILLIEGGLNGKWTKCLICLHSFFILLILLHFSRVGDEQWTVYAEWKNISANGQLKNAMVQCNLVGSR